MDDRKKSDETSHRQSSDFYPYILLICHLSHPHRGHQHLSFNLGVICYARWKKGGKKSPRNWHPMLTNKGLINREKCLGGFYLETRVKSKGVNCGAAGKRGSSSHLSGTLWNIFSNQELHADFIKKSGKIK